MDQKEFLNYFPNCLIQSFDDVVEDGKKRGRKDLAKVFSFNEALIEKMQLEGAGIYFSVNPTADRERLIEKVINISALGLDLDVCKEREGKSVAEIDNKKLDLLDALGKLEDKPHLILLTKNGLQPIWLFEPFTNYSSPVDANKLYRSVVQGLCDFIGVKSEGDNVVRVLRLPFTQHLKNLKSPFNIDVFSSEPDRPRYRFGDFLVKYKAVEAVKQRIEKKEIVKEDLIQKIKRLPLDEVIVRVAGSKNIAVTFQDNSNGSRQIIENGELTSGFISSRGEFCYSSSGTGRRGNQVTVVKHYLSLSTNSEAIKWLKKEYDLKVGEDCSYQNSVNESPSDLLLLIGKSEYTKYISISGQLADRFYQTVFVSDSGKYRPYVLFEDGTFLPVKLEKRSKDEGANYNYIELEGVKCIFNTQEQLWFQSNLVNTVDNQGITDFIEGQVPDRITLFQQVKELISQYYDFFNEVELLIVVAHVAHTYLLGLLGKTFYLLLDGEKDTGKSSLQNVMALLQHNGCFSGNSTMPSLVRKIHGLRASVNLDEIDKYDQKDKPIITGILNTGAYEGGTKEIVNMDGKKGSDQLRIYNTFSSKTFSANQVKFDSSFLSRCATIHTVRNKRHVKDVHTLTEEDKQQFQDLRNKLFAYCLKSGRSVVKEIKQIQLSSGLYGRRADIFSIITGIISHFTGNADVVRSYLLEKEEMEKQDETDNDRLSQTIIFLLERSLYVDSSQTISFQNRELLNYLITGLDPSSDYRFYPTASSVGRLLKRSKIVQNGADRKREAGKGNFSYVIPIPRIVEIAERMGNEDFKPHIAEIQSKSSQNSKNLASERGVNGSKEAQTEMEGFTGD